MRADGDARVEVVVIRDSADTGKALSRVEAAPTNFADVLPAGESDLAQQLTKDPYVLDLLALHSDVKERHLE